MLFSIMMRMDAKIIMEIYDFQPLPMFSLLGLVCLEAKLAKWNFYHLYKLEQFVANRLV